MKKLLIAAGFLAAATSTAWAQIYVNPSAPYGHAPGYYSSGYYSYSVPYALQHTLRLLASIATMASMALIPLQTTGTIC
jgi:hypothetical protein